MAAASKSSVVQQSVRCAGVDFVLVMAGSDGWAFQMVIESMVELTWGSLIRLSSSVVVVWKRPPPRSLMEVNIRGADLGVEAGHCIDSAAR